MITKLPHPLRGVITAMVTPLRQDLTWMRKGLERLIEHLISGGVHGIFILGTTGEAPNLPYNTRSALIEQTCKRLASRVPVIVGITDTSYRDALRMAAKSYECGALAVVAAPRDCTRRPRPNYSSISVGWQGNRRCRCFFTTLHSIRTCGLKSGR